jgi:branched-chain amino acid transport system ATP-binding protein
MELVMPVCSTVTVLDQGEILASGTPEEIRANPAVVQAYLGASAGAAQ